MQEKWAVWAAVSSRRQAGDDKDSIPHQLRDGRAYVAKRQGIVVAELVVPGESRSHVDFHDALTYMDKVLCQDEENPYRALETLLDGRKIDHLWCRSRDRLGRTMSLITGIEERCRRANVRLVSQQMPPSGSEVGDLYIAAFDAAGGQREIFELVRRKFYGERAKALRGGLMVTHMPFGYQAEYDEAGKRRAVIEPDEAAAYRWLVQEILNGKSTYVDIIQRLTAMFPHRKFTGLNTILRNPFYAGLTTWTGTAPDGEPVSVQVEGQHDAIIDRETWDELQALMDLRSQRRRPNTNWLWAGIVYCGYCGTPMYANVSRKRYKDKKLEYLYYYCGSWKRNRQCQPNGIKLEDVTAGVVGYLQELYDLLADEVDAVLLVPSSGPDLRPALDARLADLEQQRSRLITLFSTGRIDVDAFDDHDANLSQQALAVMAQLQELDKQQAAQQRQRQAATVLSSALPTLADDLAALDAAEANRWLRRIFAAVHVKRGRVVGVRLSG